MLQRSARSTSTAVRAALNRNLKRVGGALRLPAVHFRFSSEIADARQSQRQESDATAPRSEGTEARIPTQFDPSDDSLPDDLRLPTPASLWERFYAASIDATLSIALGSAPFAACHLAGMEIDVSLAAGAGTAGFLFCIRDWLWEEGTRSYGKSVAGLELTGWDGQLVGPETALLRNAPLAVILGGVLAPTSILEHPASLLLIFETASMASTADGRRAGDYMLGSRVVLSEEGRKERLLDLAEGRRMHEIREELAKVDPALQDDLMLEGGMHSLNSGGGEARALEGVAGGGAGTGPLLSALREGREDWQLGEAASLPPVPGALVQGRDRVLGASAEDPGRTDISTRPTGLESESRQ